MLSVLGPSEDAAALEYRKLHERLSRFFEWNNAEDPAALADEAIDRFAKRMTEADDTKQIRNPAAFALGIARLLLLENARRRQKKLEAIRHWDAQQQKSNPSEAEEIDAALEHCMQAIQPDRRRLIEQYYLGNQHDKAKGHQELASKLGVTIHALRNRALRARQELEACMRKFLAKDG